MSSQPPEPDIVLPTFDVPASFRTVDPNIFSMQVDSEGTGAIVHVSGELDVLTAPLLWEGLEKVIGAWEGGVVLDLAGTSFVDSMALGVIIRASKRLGEAGRPYSLRSLQPPVRKVFEITHLDSAIDIKP